MVLSTRTVIDLDGIGLHDVVCRQEPRQGRVSEHAVEPALVFVRQGAFRRTVNGATSLLDPTLAYAMNPGDESATTTRTPKATPAPT